MEVSSISLEYLYYLWLLFNAYDYFEKNALKILDDFAFGLGFLTNLSLNEVMFSSLQVLFLACLAFCIFSAITFWDLLHLINLSIAQVYWYTYLSKFLIIKLIDDLAFNEQQWQDVLKLLRAWKILEQFWLLDVI